MKVKGWEDFQHYKDRSPPWIKLHKTLLDNYEYQCLPIASKALAPMLWLLASEKINGEFDGDIKKLAFRLRWPEKDILDGIKPLISGGFIIDDSTMLAKCLQRAMPETETEGEKETKKRHTSSEKFDQFWKSYPKKVGKGFAEKAWEKQKPDLNLVLKSLEWQKESEQWKKDGGQFIPNPATYLNQRRWEDEPLSPEIAMSTEKPWFLSYAKTEEKAKQLGIVIGRDEQPHQFSSRIFKAAGITPEMFRKAKLDWDKK